MTARVYPGPSMIEELSNMAIQSEGRRDEVTIIEDGRTVGSGYETESTWREQLGPAQVIAFVFGVLLTVVGIVGLVRAGTDNLTGQTVVVGGLSMTALLAIIHLSLGVISLLGLPGSYAAKSSLAVVGTILVIGGILALIQPMEAMGWTDTNGVVYLIAGLLGIIIATQTPTRTASERVVRRV